MWKNAIITSKRPWQLFDGCGIIVKNLYSPRHRSNSCQIEKTERVSYEYDTFVGRIRAASVAVV